MATPNQNQLIVEGYEDLQAVVGLMQHNMTWPRDPRPVEIKIAKSAGELLEPAYLSAEFKQSGLRALGLIVDADDVFDARWKGLRSFCVKFFANVPTALPIEGLILENDEGVRCGVWIMPNNSAAGMLETFCANLIPEEQQKSWQQADAAMKLARGVGAPWRDCHSSKAQIHTWLAWQDPPGERIGIALTKKTLDPQSSGSQKFVEWFKKLYRFD